MGTYSLVCSEIHRCAGSPRIVGIRVVESDGGGYTGVIVVINGNGERTCGFASSDDPDTAVIRAATRWVKGDRRPDKYAPF